MEKLLGRESNALLLQSNPLAIAQQDRYIQIQSSFQIQNIVRHNTGDGEIARLFGLTREFEASDMEGLLGA